MRAGFYLTCLLLLGLPQNLTAQLWSGNLGPPLVNIDFGSGNSQPLPPNTTSLTYTHGCPPPGSYSLEHFLFGCAGGSWVMLTGDHTGNHDGNYMLVNGATAPGTVIVDTVTGLCSNTTYQFSAWITNCMQAITCGGNPVLPNITLTIETLSGSVLASANTGDIPVVDTKTWKQYGMVYITGASPPAVIFRIKSNTGGTCGSSFVLDDVTVRAAGPLMAITLNGQSISTLDICATNTDPLLLQATYSAGFADPVVQWESSADTGTTWHDIPGATNVTYLIPKRKDSVIVYRMRMAERANAGNITCSIYSNKILVNVHALPVQNSLTQVLGCLNTKLVLNPPVLTGTLTYQWTGPNGFTSNQQSPVIANVQYTNQGLYTVLFAPDFFCTILDSLQVNVFPGTVINTQKVYNICQGDAVNLSATGTGNYVWTPAATLSNGFIPNPVATTADSIQYKVVLTNVYGCKDSALVDINVYKRAEVNAGPDKTILYGDTVLLQGDVKGTAVNFSWSPASFITNAASVQPGVFPVTDTRYTLTAVSAAGCGKATSSVFVKVFKDVYLPGAFSPNGDGLNDVFHVFIPDTYQLISFDIFNRWGKKVFSTTSSASSWDGTIKGIPQEPGTFIYNLQMKNKYGKKLNRKGSILLLR